MISIKGKLSDLYDVVPTYLTLASVKNCPIVQDGKCIGIVKYIDTDKDEWQGYLFGDTKIMMF